MYIGVLPMQVGSRDTVVHYGPLAAGATNFTYEGAPTCPRRTDFIRHKHHVDFYTAPTAIKRSCA